MNFATSKTMRIAQQLYEGVDVKGSGTVGIITISSYGFYPYFRRGRFECKKLYWRAVWQSVCGKAEGARKSGSQKIQDAHEAIRPTDVTRTPAMLKDSLSRDQFRLYQLIWKRFVAKPYDACSL